MLGDCAPSPEVVKAVLDPFHAAGLTAVKPTGLTLAHPHAFGYDSPAMEPTNPTTSPLRYPLAPNSQTACYSPWLKVRVLIRAALTMHWSTEAWPEVREHLKWLLAEEYRLQRQGWLN